MLPLGLQGLRRQDSLALVNMLETLGRKEGGDAEGGNIEVTT